MKTKFILLFFIPLFVGINLVNGQGFTPPSPGKAVVYFARVSKYGAGASFEYFHQDKYIGIFKGKNYMRYECNPGKNLLWASCENKEFITTDLKAGESYIVIVDVIMGAFKAHVGFSPISVKDTEKFERAKELIKKQAPVVTPQDKIDKMNIKLEKFIKEKLAQYESEWKNTRNFRHISQEMAIPAEAMK